MAASATVDAVAVKVCMLKIVAVALQQKPSKQFDDVFQCV